MRRALCPPSAKKQIRFNGHGCDADVPGHFNAAELRRDYPALVPASRGERRSYRFYRALSGPWWRWAHCHYCLCYLRGQVGFGLPISCANNLSVIGPNYLLGLPFCLLINQSDNGV